MRNRHSKADIAAKLTEADDLARQGKLQSEISRTLGVSVMTLHRWRKQLLTRTNGQSPPDQTAKLELENALLRRLVTDLLLEKIALEEALGNRSS